MKNLSPSYSAEWLGATVVYDESVPYPTISDTRNSRQIHFGRGNCPRSLPSQVIQAIAEHSCAFTSGMRREAGPRVHATVRSDELCVLAKAGDSLTVWTLRMKLWVGCRCRTQGLFEVGIL